MPAPQRSLEKDRAPQQVQAMAHVCLLQGPRSPVGPADPQQETHRVPLKTSSIG